MGSFCEMNRLFFWWHTRSANLLGIVIHAHFRGYGKIIWSNSILSAIQFFAAGCNLVLRFIRYFTRLSLRFKFIFFLMRWRNCSYALSPGPYNLESSLFANSVYIIINFARPPVAVKYIGMMLQFNINYNPGFINYLISVILPLKFFVTSSWFTMVHWYT